MGYGTYIGPLNWSLVQDDLGYRTYTLLGLVQAGLTTDGPASALFASGAPLIGSTWTFGTIIDPWVWCRPEAQVRQWQANPGDPSIWWTLEQKFSNKPFSSKKRNACRNQSFDDPLAEPALVSGGFTKYTEEKKYDKDGNPIWITPNEFVEGPPAEWDSNRPNVHIEQNVAALGLGTFTSMVDHVNDSPLWGLPARCIKLSNAQWDRKIYGTCGFYYTRKFDFDIRFDTFDRHIPSIASHCIVGDWVDNGMGGKTWTQRAFSHPPVPADYMQMLDKNGNPTRGPVYNGVSSGTGPPAHYLGELIVNSDPTPNIALDPVKYYPEANFLTLGIPSSF